MCSVSRAARVALHAYHAGAPAPTAAREHQARLASAQPRRPCGGQAPTAAAADAITPPGKAALRR